MRRLAALPVLAVVALAGCGGGDDVPRETRDSDRPPADLAAPPDAGALRRFEQCLRENGVEVPKPSQDGPTMVEPPPEEVRRKCEKHLPEGGPQLAPDPRQVPLP